MTYSEAECGASCVGCVEMVMSKGGEKAAWLLFRNLWRMEENNHLIG